MIRKVLKPLIKTAVSIDLVWKVINFCLVQPAAYARIARNASLSQREPKNVSVEERILSGLTELRVMRGPFQGLRYPVAKSIGSVIAPKLLGFYEYELHEVMADCCNGKYKTIVDIGSAEGYYAIGLGLRNPNAVVYAFDTNLEANELCSRMAAVNNISERVMLGSLCTTETLLALELRSPCLIICDCEGYEKELFNPSLREKLDSAELLIELHDMVDEGISAYIKELFSETHQLRSLYSENDNVKVDSCFCEELEGFSREDRIAVLSERRSRQMEWAFFTPRNCSSADSFQN